jgi:hypothetical protein
MEKAAFFMSPAKRKTVALAAAALILIAAYATAFILKNGSDAASAAPEAAIWDLPVDSIASIHIESPEEDILVFERAGSLEWVLSSPADLRYDGAIAAALPLSVARLVPEKEIGEGESGGEPYGLDAPAATVHVFLGGGDKLDIFIGGATATGEGYYFRVNGSNAIYTMSAEKAHSLMLNRLNVLDRNVLGFNRSLRLPAIAENISGITVNGEIADNAEEMADALSQLNALDFYDAADLARYGLDTPRFAVTFENEYGQHALYIGNDINDEETYARVDGLDAVFSLPSRNLPW